MRVRCFGVLLLVHTALANVTTTKDETSTISVTNATKNEVISITKTIPLHDLLKVVMLKTGRRRNKKSRSTSSSSGERVIKNSKQSEDKTSLDIQSSEASSTSDSDDKRNKTLGTGWRRWHRKCTPCPEDMVKRWREPNIEWICGGFQRARRTFKSECMMHFRNCQDGTMFVKIHNHKCSDTEAGRHWFYDYTVRLTDDSSDSYSSDTSDDKSTDDTDSIHSLSLGK